MVNKSELNRMKKRACAVAEALNLDIEQITYQFYKSYVEENMEVVFEEYSKLKKQTGGNNEII
jgi:hypothetical protein